VPRRTIRGHDASIAGLVVAEECFVPVALRNGRPDMRVGDGERYRLEARSADIYPGLEGLRCGLQSFTAKGPESLTSHCGTDETRWLTAPGALTGKVHRVDDSSGWM
jgi:hypothetical protein